MNSTVASWVKDIKLVLKGIFNDPVKSQNIELKPKRLMSIGFAMWLPFIVVTHYILASLMNASLMSNHYAEWGELFASATTAPTIGFSGNIKVLVVTLVPLVATFVSIKMCASVLKVKIPLEKLVYNVGLIYIPTAIFLFVMVMLGITYVKTLMVVGVFTFCSTISLVNGVFVHGMNQTERKTLLLTPITMILSTVSMHLLYGLFF